jgi:toxin ParE1/3/4
MPDRYVVELTEGAEQDLETLHAYVAEHRSGEEADTLLDNLLAKIELLEHYPDRGNVPKELDALGMREFRQILLSPYRLIYRVVDDRVFIMVIVDGRRDMAALLEQRLLGRSM